jgi:hypothetical protein
MGRELLVTPPLTVACTFAMPTETPESSPALLIVPLSVLLVQEVTEFPCESLLLQPVVEPSE